MKNYGTAETDKQYQRTIGGRPEIEVVHPKSHIHRRRLFLHLRLRSHEGGTGEGGGTYLANGNKVCHHKMIYIKIKFNMKSLQKSIFIFTFV